jgi:uncharacterized iron-regulated membrane protein
MMTGTLGALMWLMMIAMMLGMAAGVITWTQRRLHTRSARLHAPRPSQTPSDRVE